MPSCSKCSQRSCCRKRCACIDANIDTKIVLREVADQVASGDSIPADPNAAIGFDRIVTIQNEAVQILDKNSLVRLNMYDAREFFGAVPITNITDVADPIAYFDHLTNRFILTLWEVNNNPAGAPLNNTTNATLIINSPPAIAGNYQASRSSAFTGNFSVTNNVVPANPLGASTPLTNAAQIAGKIALIASNNFNDAGSVTKVQNAFNAGAIGVIIIFSGETIDATVAGISQIPTLSVINSVGQSILNQINLGNTVNVTLSSTIAFPGTFNSRMFISVSKTSSPTTADDFYHYVIGGPNVGQPYFQINADFPKLGVDESALYIVSDKRNAPRRFQTVAVRKEGLINGTTVQVPNYIPNSDILLNLIETGPPNPDTVSGFPIPSILRPPKTQSRQVTYFVFGAPQLTPARSNITVRALYDILSGSPQIRDFVIPVEPWVLLGGPTQPPVQIFPPPFNGSTVVPDLVLGPINIFTYRAVAFKDSLWASQHVRNNGKTEARWYEFDTSKIFDANTPTITLRQSGRIIPEGLTSAFFPSVDVDKDGNMGIGFVLSGPEKYVTLAHTGRLANDPLGTIRLPWVEVLPASAPYISSRPATVDINPADVSSRFDDYASLDLDPSDGKTFWYYSEYVNQNLALLQNQFIRQGWFTALHSFCVNSGCGLVNNRPGTTPAITETNLRAEAERESEETDEFNKEV